MRNCKLKTSTVVVMVIILAAISTSLHILLTFGRNSSHRRSSFSTVSAVSDKISVPVTTAEKKLNYSRPTENFDVEQFYSTDLLRYPEQANKLSILLTSRKEVIAEAQRIHMQVFGALLRDYKYAMLLDYAPTENKGDSAISVGEMILLRKLNVNVVFACPAGKCIRETLKKAVEMSKRYSEKELVILFHGGGNVIGFHSEDKRRFAEIKEFQRFHIVMFPQSILYRGPKDHINLCKRVYASHEKLTFIWRDKVSFKLGKELFPKVQSLLTPDIAYQIGHVHRFMQPTHDILYLRREDAETPGFKGPVSAKEYSMAVSGWLSWKSPKGASSMEDAFLATTNGMSFLQRGRVVITDRLHGHILSTLLDIPHVYVDNKQRKISNYHNTWTAGVDNIVLANSSGDAINQARKLLIKLDNSIPKVIGNFDTPG